MKRQREVFYVLERERDDKFLREPVSTEPTYLIALAKGKSLNRDGWHHKITRVSIPFYPVAS